MQYCDILQREKISKKAQEKIIIRIIKTLSLLLIVLGAIILRVIRKINNNKMHCVAINKDSNYKLWWMKVIIIY